MTRHKEAIRGRLSRASRLCYTQFLCSAAIYMLFSCFQCFFRFVIELLSTKTQIDTWYSPGLFASSALSMYTVAS